MTQVRKAQAKHKALGLGDQEVLELYRKMVVIRALDDRIWLLNRQGKAAIAASSQGHEGAQFGVAWAALKDGNCFFFPYYRDLALKFLLGVDTKEILLSFLAKDGEPFSGARQFALQGAYLKHRIIQPSNVVSANLTQAVGYALACKMQREKTVTIAIFGDGGSSQGECHEAMNFAGIHKLPIVFICENNRYAISVPLKKQMAVENVADRAVAYGFPGVVADGMDILEAYRVTREAIEKARSQGPILVELKVERYRPHTTDDDDRRYRSREELEEARKRDPLILFRNYLMEAGLLTEEKDKEFQDQARAEVNEATDFAEAAPFPDPSTFYDHLYAP